MSAPKASPEVNASYHVDDPQKVNQKQELGKKKKTRMKPSLHLCWRSSVYHMFLLHIVHMTLSERKK